MNDLETLFHAEVRKQEIDKRTVDKLGREQRTSFANRWLTSCNSCQMSDVEYISVKTFRPDISLSTTPAIITIHARRRSN